MVKARSTHQGDGLDQDAQEGLARMRGRHVLRGGGDRHEGDPGEGALAGALDGQLAGSRGVVHHVHNGVRAVPAHASIQGRAQEAVLQQVEDPSVASQGGFAAFAS